MNWKEVIKETIGYLVIGLNKNQGMILFIVILFISLMLIIFWGVGLLQS